MSGNFEINPLNPEDLKTKIQTSLNDDDTTNKITTSSDVVMPIPVVEEKQENENTGFDLVEIRKNENLSVKSLAHSSNSASQIYYNVKSIRTNRSINNGSGETSDSDTVDKSSGVEDFDKYVSDQNDNDINNKMLKLHDTYQARYGDKYLHGYASTNDEYQHDFGVNINSYSTNNNANVIIGTKNSATEINGTFEYSKVVLPKDNSDESEPENMLNKAQGDADGDYPDPHVDPNPPQRDNIGNNKSYDFSILHNRNISIAKRKCITGGGIEYHSYNSGDNTQLSFRGGLVDAATGFGVTITANRYGSVDEDGNKHYLRNNKVKAIILNNEIDEYPREEAINNGVQDVSDLPIVNTKNKFGIQLNTDNENMGVDLSYVVRDFSAITKKNTYKRNQLYAKAGYQNQPQGEDTPDKHKITLGAVYNYQQIKANGDYFNAKVNADYQNTMQSGSKPDYLVGVAADIDTKIKAHQIAFHGAVVKTENTKFLTLTTDYKCSTKNNKWDFGSSFGYCKMDSMGEPQEYFTVAGTVAYKF